MATDDTPRFPWTGTPAEWLRTWQAMWRTAPDNLAQSILQGWTLNINSNNSTAPQTEAEVVARHSYGLQIGRMSDALELLITERHGVKQDAAAARVERIVKDLALLKAQDEKQYVRLRDALRDALK
jgi:hypothetical protein